MLAGTAIVAPPCVLKLRLMVNEVVYACYSWNVSWQLPSLARESLDHRGARFFLGGEGRGRQLRAREQVRKCGGGTRPSRPHPRSATASKYWLLPVYSESTISWSSMCIYQGIVCVFVLLADVTANFSMKQIGELLADYSWTTLRRIRAWLNILNHCIII